MTGEMLSPSGSSSSINLDPPGAVLELIQIKTIRQNP